MEFKKKIVIISVSVIVLLGAMLIGVAYYNYNKKLEDTQKEITKVIEQNIQKYMKEYASTGTANEDSQSQAKTLTKNTSNGSDLTFTNEQINTIIKSTTERVEAGLLKEITSRFSSLKQETMSGLEAQIDEKIREVFSIEPEKPMPLEQEISEISNAIQLIVESNVLSIVQERYKLLSKSMSVLEVSINKKINIINSTLMDYENRIWDLERSMISNKSKIENINGSLDLLRGQYSNFVKTALITTNIISDMSRMPADKNGVVSAKSGYEMNRKIEDLQKDLVNKYESLVVSIEEINKQLEDNIQKIKDAASTKEAVNKAIEALQAADANNIESIDNAKKLLEEAIVTAKNDASNEAQDAKNVTLEKLTAIKDKLHQDIHEAGDDTAAVQNALDIAKNGLQDQLVAINSKITVLNNTVTGLKSRIGKIESDVDILRTTTQSNYNNISKAKSDIEDANKSINSLENYSNTLSNTLSSLTTISTNIKNASDMDLQNYITNLEQLLSTYEPGTIEYTQINNVLIQVIQMKDLQDSGKSTADELEFARKSLEESIADTSIIFTDKIALVTSDISSIQKDIEQSNNVINENTDSIKKNSDDISNIKDTKLSYTYDEATKTLTLTK